MIRFTVHDSTGRVTAFVPRHTSLVGKDDMTVPGVVAFEDGLLVCRKHTNDAAAASLQVDAGEMGVLTVQTCLLPDRAEPYCLELELARHRIMLLLNKLEEWSLALLPSDNPVIMKLDEARSLFTKALVAPLASPEDGVRQAQLARQALAMGIEAGEDMTRLQAERDLAIRLKPPPEPDSDLEDTRIPISAPKPPKLGCVVPVGQFAEPLQRIVTKSFDFVSVPLHWSELEANEGKRTFAPSDRWIEWAVRKGKLPVAAGPLLDLRRGSLPEWLYIWENDYKSLRELAYEHLKAVVTRYRRAVTRWSVIGGANVNSALNLRIEEMIDLTRLAVLTVRKLQPTAKVIVDLDQPFGEHGTHLDRSISPVLYAGLVKEAGISIDGFGIRIQMGDGEPGRSCRDLMQFSDILDIFSKFEKPIYVTALGVPSEPPPTRIPNDHSEVELKLADDIGQPGLWRSQWTLPQQAEWMTRALLMAAGKPYVESVACQALYDTADSPEMQAGGLISTQGKAKPSLKRVSEIASALAAKRIPTISSDRSGSHANRSSSAPATR